MLKHCSITIAISQLLCHTVAMQTYPLRISQCPCLEDKDEIDVENNPIQVDYLQVGLGNGFWLCCMCGLTQQDDPEVS